MGDTKGGMGTMGTGIGDTKGAMETMGMGATKGGMGTMGPGEEQWGQWGQEGSSGGVAHWDHPGGPKSHCPHRTPWESCVPKCPQMSPTCH